MGWISAARRRCCTESLRNVGVVDGFTTAARERAPRVELIDVAVAVGAFALAACTAVLASIGDGEPAFTLAAAIVLAAQSAALVIRRRTPVVSGVLVGAFAVLYGVIDWPDPLLPVPAIVSLATVFERCRRSTALTMLVVAALAATLATGLAGDSDALDWAAVVLTLTAGAVIGEMLRTRHHDLAVLERRAVELETDRAQAIADAERAERHRIARELHDLVTHNVTLLVVQAEAAASRPTMDDAERVERLDALAGSGRAALAELRQLLGVLRDPGDGPSSTPTAGLAHIDELVATARRGGLSIELDTPQPSPSLAASVDLATYRIVQEGLTNVIRHAGATHVHVDVTCSDGWVVVSVADDGRGVDGEPSVHGVGLAGINERVRLLDGVMRTGRSSIGGFLIEARIPIGVQP